MSDVETTLAAREAEARYLLTAAYVLVDPGDVATTEFNERARNWLKAGEMEQ